MSLNYSDSDQASDADSIYSSSVSDYEEDNISDWPPQDFSDTTPSIDSDDDMPDLIPGELVGHYADFDDDIPPRERNAIESDFTIAETPNPLPRPPIFTPDPGPQKYFISANSRQISGEEFKDFFWFLDRLNGDVFNHDGDVEEGEHGWHTYEAYLTTEQVGFLQGRGWWVVEWDVVLGLRALARGDMMEVAMRADTMRL